MICRSILTNFKAMRSEEDQPDRKHGRAG